VLDVVQAEEDGVPDERADVPGDPVASSQKSHSFYECDFCLHLME
jgi:hypothetical protein